ncbi:MAG TPA: substrate-binding domain-containing protein [Anaerolineaceae bacterium]
MPDLSIILSMAYTRLSRNLRPQPTIGVLCGWQVYSGTLESFLDCMFQGILAGAADCECNLLLACSSGIPYGIGLGRPAWPLLSSEVDFIPVGPWNCDGLIILPPIGSAEITRYVIDLVESGYPVVFAGDWTAGSSVVVDNQSGIIQAMDHLVAHGHRRIAYIAGSRGRVEGDAKKRYRAYLAALQKHGLEYDPNLVAIGFHTYAGGRNAMEQILQRKTPFSALIASNDRSAVGAMRALDEAGLLVPQDVAVIGFDDVLDSRAQVPMLTTVHYPMFDVGYEAVNLLLKHISGEHEKPETITIPTSLVIRESCGCMAGLQISASRGEAIPNPAGYIPIKEPITHETIPQAIAAVINAEAHHLGVKEVDYLCRRLVESIRFSLAKANPADFFQTLQQILRRASSLQDDLYTWHKAISMLRDAMPILIREQASALSQDEIGDMFNQAQVMVGEVSRGQFSSLSLAHGRMAFQIGEMSARFFTSKDENEVFAELNHRLPEIGINHAVVAYYAPEKEDPAAWSVLQTAFPQVAKDKLRYPTREFPPESLFPTDRLFSLAVLPLQIEGVANGYIAFHTGNLQPYATIIQQLVVALRGIHLYRQADEARRIAEEGKQMAEEANRLKNRFLSWVSHELRTPLSLISGLSDMLLRESGQSTSEVNRADIERIYLSANYLDGLIRDVLDLARMDVGHLNLIFEPLDIREVLETVAMIGEQLAHDKNLSFTSRLPANLPKVLGDRTRLRQVALNLINNAVKFTSHGGVTLSADAEDGRVIVQVSDTGLGIPLDEQQLIFDEFRQSTRTSERGFGGLGLGLAICRRLVEKHFGEITVTSSGEEGEGSTFTFSLPVMEQPAPLSDQPGLLREGLVVALLAGNQEQGDWMEFRLKQKGCQVHFSLIYERADWFSWLLELQPDVVILDTCLAEAQGWKILRTIKGNPNTRHILTLFYNLAEEHTSGSLLELDYLTKPMGVAELNNALMLQGMLASSDGPAATKTILIVDDDPVILDLHSRIVKSQGVNYRVLQAKNGRDGLELIRREHPDLVMLDLMMPEMNGFEVLERMREDEQTRSIPVIVVTGQVLTEEDMQRLDKGVASVLKKGVFSAEETVEHLLAVFDRRRKPGSDSQRMVLKAMAYIHTHYSEPILRNDIASYIGVSERHLTRSFHQEVGLTPVTYLNRYRIQQAKLLLESGNQNITNIAMDVGFSSSGYFTRVFREEVGISPRLYQQKNRA